MKTKLLSLLGAVLCAATLSSCYVYDAPLTWVDPCPRPVYGRGFYSPPVYRSYSSPRYGFGHGLNPGHCAPSPRSFHGHHGRFH